MNRATSYFWAIVLLMGCQHAAQSESIIVGDIEIDPQDFSADLSSDQRIARCLACHGDHAAGDIDFGPDVRFGTPELHGMTEQYIKGSLIAYQEGTRKHEEMSVISTMLNAETVDFMARTFAAFPTPPMKSASALAALAERDDLFRQGQKIAGQGIAEKGVPACAACHGPLGEGSAAGPRLAGQNVMYIKSQFSAFAGGLRQTGQSPLMQPVVQGLTDDAVRAVAHYYESVAEISVDASPVEGTD